ncbi:T9SS type A sorting domain-containing protein [Psychroserpens sp. MEBiC05023]
MKNKTTFNATHKQYVLSLIVAIMFSTVSFAQPQVVGEEIPVNGFVCEFPEVFDPNAEPVSIPSAVTVSTQSRGSFCSEFIVTYNGFTGPAQTAFQYAVDIWANTLESTIPIRVNATFEPLGAGVLGGAAPNGYFELTGGGLPPNTIYARALAEKLTNSEIGANSIDINCSFSSDTNWYFGTDANPAFTQFDFVSVVLHELGHGLGFAGFARLDGPGTSGELRISTGLVTAFDNFVENGAGISILDFSDPSFALKNAYEGGDLFSVSPLAVAANGGIAPEKYAPGAFQPGSSYYHWDDFTFPNANENSLMTPSIANGQANHNTGPITRGLFTDMGWTVCDALSVNELELEGLEVSPNPFKGNVRITLPGTYNDSDFNISVFDINGRVVFKRETMSNNNVIDVNLSELTTSIYFMQIEDITTGLSVTKKVVKQ